MRNLIAYFSLFASSATLVCCAIPALFVAVGAGASLVSLVGTFPQLIWLSEHKEIIFIIGGILLLLTSVLQLAAKSKNCPVDPKLAKACQTTRGFSVWIYIFSLLIYGIGAFFAFLAPSLLI